MEELDCESCGVCCAKYRVSFYWAETDAHPAGTVPQAMTKAISPHLVAMCGTTQKPERCVALVGELMQSVSCSIYAQRSSTCRELEKGSELCLKARAEYQQAQRSGPAVITGTLLPTDQ